MSTGNFFEEVLDDVNAVEEKLLGTGGAIKLAMKKTKCEL